MGTVWLITPTTRYTSCPGNSASPGCVVGALVDPGMTRRVAVDAARGADDRVRRSHQPARRQHHEDVIKFGRVSIQPKIDFFNLLNVAPVTTVLGQNYGTAAYNQPSSVLVGRVFQLGFIAKF